MLGAALSGLAYGLVGRHLRTAFRGGYYLTGIVTIAPYVLALPYVVRLIDGVSIARPFTGTDLAISAAMTLFYGGLDLMTMDAAGHMTMVEGAGSLWRAGIFLVLGLAAIYGGVRLVERAVRGSELRQGAR